MSDFRDVINLTRKGYPHVIHRHARTGRHVATFFANCQALKIEIKKLIAASTHNVIKSAISFFIGPPLNKFG
jgi:hypothetical protein